MNELSNPNWLKWCLSELSATRPEDVEGSEVEITGEANSSKSESIPEIAKYALLRIRQLEQMLPSDK
ncbi:hypothetical protein 13VV501A_gene0065 [Vibrio phage 13VV501A]|nr:hypothetical protein 13VV501A_gene0065 [Vibrio phage 13VV501A]